MANRRAAPCILALALVASCAWDYGRFDPPPAPCDGACVDASGADAFDLCTTRAGADLTTGPAQLHTQLHEPSPRNDHTFDLRPTTSDAFPMDTAADHSYAMIFGDVDPSRHLCILGGSIAGQIPPGDTWRVAGLAGPGGLRVAGVGWYVIDGMRVDNVPAGLTLEGTGPVYVRNVYVTNIRDRCIDNTLSVPGFIEDSVFDACNQGLAEASQLSPLPPQTGGDLVLDGVLMRLSPMPNDAAAPMAPPGSSHGLLFSHWNAGANHLVIRDSVFEIDTAPNGSSLPTYPPTASAPWQLFPDGTTCENVTVVFVPNSTSGPMQLPPFTTGGSTCAFTRPPNGSNPYTTRLRDWQLRHGYATTRGG